MADVRYVQKNGNQLIIGMSDNTRKIALPTSQGMWLVSGTGTGPGPEPSGDIAWPFNKNVITSGYGPRTGGVGTFHEGVDFSGGKAVLGADILVAADGIVKISTSNSGFGNYVGVFHKTMDGFDFWTVYGHLDSRSVNVGDAVTKGTKVGALGATGTITGPCLHWETHKCAIGGSPIWNTMDNGNPRTAVDPIAFMTAYGSAEILNA